MREEKPELKKGQNGKPETPENKCENCGAEYSITEWDMEREEIAKHTDRKDYWCPDCGAHIGTKIDYYGPVPVQIGPNTYEMQ